MRHLDKQKRWQDGRYYGVRWYALKCVWFACRIWQHLVEIVKKGNVSVIITTHYIEEARQANVVSDQQLDPFYWGCLEPFYWDPQRLPGTILLRPTEAAWNYSPETFRGCLQPCYLDMQRLPRNKLMFAVLTLLVEMLGNTLNTLMVTWAITSMELDWTIQMWKKFPPSSVKWDAGWWGLQSSQEFQWGHWAASREVVREIVCHAVHARWAEVLWAYL